MRTAAVASLVAAAGLLTSGCSAMASGSGEAVVRIAADLELTGDLSRLGAVYRNALELRVEQVNQQGLLGSDRRLELVVRDNRSDPGVSATNIREFVDDPSVVAIVSGACWQCLEASLDTINAARIPTISLAAPNAVVEPLDQRQFIFKLGPNAEDVAGALVTELRDAQVETVAIVATDDLYGNDGLKAMSAAAKRAGMNVVIEEALTAEGGGISSVTRAIAEYQPEVQPGQFQDQTEPAGPDAVVAWGYAPFGAEVAAGLRGAGYEGRLFLDPGAADDLFISGSSAEAISGAIMIFTETLVIDEVVATSPAKANRRNWFNDYTARHGTYHAFSSFGADAIEIIVSSINQTDSVERESLRSALEAIELDGFSGAIRMSPQHHSGLMTNALAVLMAREDRWSLAS